MGTLTDNIILLNKKGRIARVIFFAILWASVGCQSKTKISEQESDLNQKVSELETELLEKSKKIEMIEERNSLLRTLVGKKSTNHSVVARPNSESIKYDIPLSDEKACYQFIIEYFQKKNITGVLAGLSALQNNFSESDLIDNGMYMLGRLYVDSQEYSKALEVFNDIIKDYPLGNKRQSALLEKGRTYLLMNLPDFARKVFKQVIGEYPNSLEAKRASVQLSVLKSKS